MSPWNPERPPSPVQLRMLRQHVLLDVIDTKIQYIVAGIVYPPSLGCQLGLAHFGLLGGHSIHNKRLSRCSMANAGQKTLLDPILPGPQKTLPLSPRLGVASGWHTRPCASNDQLQRVCLYLAYTYLQGLQGMCVNHCLEGTISHPAMFVPQECKNCPPVRWNPERPPSPVQLRMLRHHVFLDVIDTEIPYIIGGIVYPPSLCCQLGLATSA